MQLLLPALKTHYCHLSDYGLHPSVTDLLELTGAVTCRSDPIIPSTGPATSVPPDKHLMCECGKDMDSSEGPADGFDSMWLFTCLPEHMVLHALLAAAVG